MSAEMKTFGLFFWAIPAGMFSNRMAQMTAVVRVMWDLDDEG
jgi:hypothetical protein